MNDHPDGNSALLGALSTGEEITERRLGERYAHNNELRTPLNAILDLARISHQSKRIRPSNRS